MTTLSASDIAARRIREARKRRGWLVKDLAAQCKKAGFPRLTAAVITNLETRRRPGREITADELLALAWVLEVPPAQLLSPLNGGETLQIVPGEERDPLEAVAWLGDDDAALPAVRHAGSARERDTERVLRYRGSPVTALRQIRITARQIRYHDRFLSDPDWAAVAPDTPAYHTNSVTVLAVRLLHLLAALEADGYARPPLDDVIGILARHRIPASLAEWDAISDGGDEEGEPDGASA
jgi:transcriptional regulator with XRE-family HTH domain